MTICVLYSTAAFEHYDFTKAQQRLEPLAKDGNPHAQVILGHMAKISPPPDMVKPTRLAQKVIEAFQNGFKDETTRLLPD